MHLTKKQKFGLISFLLLLLAAYLVTKEPWKSKGSNIESALLNSPPLNIRLKWENLATGYPLAQVTTGATWLHHLTGGSGEVWNPVSGYGLPKKTASM